MSGRHVVAFSCLQGMAKNRLHNDVVGGPFYGHFRMPLDDGLKESFAAMPGES